MPRKLPRMKTPIELEQEKEKAISFSDRWEEELKQQLFEEEQAAVTQEQVENILEEKTMVHKARPDEE